MLNKIIPSDLISGIIVYHAEEISDTITIAFILRFYRQKNKFGFIQAFSQEPERFAFEINKLERMMKVLRVNNCQIWPRFHLNIMEDVKKSGLIELVELRYL